jgi:DNA-binding response OmpR family regulator
MILQVGHTSVTYSRFWGSILRLPTDHEVFRLHVRSTRDPPKKSGSDMDRILVIEDDLSVQRMLRRTFEPAGFEVAIAGDGAVALERFRAAIPQVVILDLLLPGKSGRDVCRDIRQDSLSVPILVLSAVTDEIDKVLLLELGADDYVTKPFSPRELLARVKAAVRRRSQTSRCEVISFDGVEANFSQMALYRNGKRVPATPLEFKVLSFFAKNEGRVLSRTELLNEVWGYHNYPTTRTVDAHILNLRKKLEKNPAEPAHFQTVHSVGYRFVR